MVRKKIKKQRGRPRGSTKLVGSITDLASTFYNLAITEIGVGIACSTLAKMFANEEKIRALELRLMRVVEVEVNDKNKKEIQYHPLKGIKKYLERFIKRNPKWVCEKENYLGIITGRYILTRVYRTYRRKIDYDDDCCPECGREYYD